ncbi:shikimate dehydrogenase [Nocardioides yefusunii]|uniref:Shikimate dehydrogenase n=1 Tax=Nocardioides yefusunii TaxID=2500546 RepID=A0ABW1QYW6_9ACTN|nr:shikimate dehydrogenase [Nocardioides yefusunii]
MTTVARTCGVLGDPIAHSLSPVLHRAGYEAVGLEWTYDAHQVAAGGLPVFLATRDENWRGLSLTMPLKREAVPLVDTLTERARRAGAVNTLVLDTPEDGSRRIHGDNTDIPGAVAAIRERTDAELRTATVLGGGATATSTGLALADLGVRHVDLLVRTPERAAETVEVLTSGPDGISVDVHLLTDDVAPGDVVVCTVPASAQTPGLVARLASAPVVFDVIYDPWPTPLAAAATGVVVSGLDLLVHQAAVQFTLFTGVEAPLAAMRAAGEAALAARGGVGSHA